MLIDIIIPCRSCIWETPSLRPLTILFFRHEQSSCSVTSTKSWQIIREFCETLFKRTSRGRNRELCPFYCCEEAQSIIILSKKHRDQALHFEQKGIRRNWESGALPVNVNWGGPALPVDGGFDFVQLLENTPTKHISTMCHEKRWKNGGKLMMPQVYQFIGEDNIYFYWSAMKLM